MASKPAKFLYPSEVRFFARVKNWPELTAAAVDSGGDHRLNSDSLSDYARRLLSHDSKYPKLQVVQLGGVWYALNSLQLAICRQLQRAGHCRRIRVLVCPAGLLPGGLGQALGRPMEFEDSSNGNGHNHETSDDRSSSESSVDDDDEEDENQGYGDSNSDSSGCSCSDSYCSECAAKEADIDDEAEGTAAAPGQIRAPITAIGRFGG
uniref:Uncharacterized protein n=1 Tax=Macrostomum lignano TaxID=282301 RepID=A0A1I8JJY7_9PLAT